MPTYRLVLEYDGTGFAGWQLQAGPHRTVQGCLEEAVARVTGESPRVTGAGRTDAGVHAAGQVASLELEREFEPGTLRRALNGVLPRDLAVREAALAASDFDARRDARGKLYRYLVWNGRSRSPLRERTHCWVPPPLELGAMAAAAAHCVGRHDFACFQSAGSQVETSVRTLSRIEVTGEPRGEIQIEVVGDGFLRHMVRSLAGTLIEVGRGRRSPDSLPELLAAADRRRAGATAPAKALTLVRVCY